MSNPHTLALRSLFPLFGLVACTAEVDTMQFGAPLDESSQSVIVGDRDWNRPYAFRDSSTYRVGSHYASATAQLRTGSGVCSGVLYDSKHILTAAHCSSPLLSSRVADFGMFLLGQRYAENRLHELGLDLWDVRYGWPRPAAEVMSFNCQVIRKYDHSYYGDRDVAVWRCDPKHIDGLGAVWPGDVWGHIDYQAGMVDLHTPTYGLSVNQLVDQPGLADSVLLSPGKVTDEDDAFFCPLGEGCYGLGFEISNDMLEGSSGAAIVNRSTNRIFGVWSGWVGGTNFGSYLPTNTALPNSAIADGAPVIDAPSFVTGWAGSDQTGRPMQMLCPERMVAGGIIGTTHPGWDTERWVGNFGVVCVPFQESPEQWRRPKEKWTVAAGGSIDTQLHARHRDFNNYVNETLDLYDPNGPSGRFDQRQSLLMCPPGQFLRGMTTTSGTYLASVHSIFCGNSQGSSTRQVELKSIGESASGQTKTLICPTEFVQSNGEFVRRVRAVTRLFVRSGWWTDGVAFECGVIDEQPL